MRIARQIGKDRLWSSEGRLGVNHPVRLAGRSQVAEERRPITQTCLVAEELKPSGAVKLDELREEEPAEQLAEDTHRQQESRTRRDPTLVVERDAAAGTIMWMCG